MIRKYLSALRNECRDTDFPSFPHQHTQTSSKYQVDSGFYPGRIFKMINWNYGYILIGIHIYKITDMSRVISVLLLPYVSLCLMNVSVYLADVDVLVPDLACLS